MENLLLKGFINKVVNQAVETVMTILFPDPIEITGENGIYKWDTNESTSASITADEETIKLYMTTPKDKRKSGVLYLFHGVDDVLLIFPNNSVFPKDFTLSIDAGKEDMLFWTLKDGKFYWRRAKGF